MAISPNKFVACGYELYVGSGDERILMEATTPEQPLEYIQGMGMMLPEFEKQVAKWKEQDEDVLTYALFPKVAEEFFEYRAAQKTKVDMTKADKDAGAYPV